MLLKTGLLVSSLFALAGCVAEVGQAGYGGGGYYSSPRTYGYGGYGGYSGYNAGPSIYVAPPPVVVERRRYWGYGGSSGYPRPPVVVERRWGYQENRGYGYRSYNPGYSGGGYRPYPQPRYERPWHSPMLPGYRHYKFEVQPQSNELRPNILKEEEAFSGS